MRCIYYVCIRMVCMCGYEVYVHRVLYMSLDMCIVCMCGDGYAFVPRMLY